jgi:hypothetical protein
MEKFFTVFTGVLSALICVIKFYFDLKKNSTKISLKEKYYRKILIPFYVKYKKKKNNGDFCKKFINKKRKKYIECIPTYVIKILEKEPEKLYMILVFDYIHMRENDAKFRNKIDNNICKLFNILLYYSAMIVGSCGLVELLLYIFELIIGIKFNKIEIIQYIVRILSGITICLIYSFISKFIMDSKDLYILNNKYIDKHINKRNKWYEKNMNKQKFFI